MESIAHSPLQTSVDENNVLIERELNRVQSCAPGKRPLPLDLTTAGRCAIPVAMATAGVDSVFVPAFEYWIGEMPDGNS